MSEEYIKNQKRIAKLELEMHNFKNEVIELDKKDDKRIEELENKFNRWIGHDVSNMCERIEELEKNCKSNIRDLDLYTKEIAELRDKLKEFDKIKATNFVEIAHIIDDHTNKLNELKERDLQLREK